MSDPRDRLRDQIRACEERIERVRRRDRRVAFAYKAMTVIFAVALLALLAWVWTTGPEDVAVACTLGAAIGVLVGLVL